MKPPYSHRIHFLYIFYYIIRFWCEFAKKILFSVKMSFQTNEVLKRIEESSRKCDYIELQKISQECINLHYIFN